MSRPLPAPMLDRMIDAAAHRSRTGLAVALFFLAPVVGEYLLGNTPVTDVASLFLLAPLYGGGALLIREVTRWVGGGWPTVFLLAAAYALLEEGPIDMMLWNPSYGGYDIGAAYAGTYVSALGTSVALLQDVLSMHVVWSICVPIAIVETFARDRTRPWLGTVGLSVTGVVFVMGSALLAALQVAQTRFVATPTELASTSAVIAALIVLAFAVRHRSTVARDAGAPAPWVVAVAAFVVTGLYWSREYLSERVPPWALAGGWLVLVAVSLALGVRWSRSRGWGATHRLALAGGALLTYVWVGYGHAREMDTPTVVALAGVVGLGGGSIVLLAVAARAVWTARVGPAGGEGVSRGARG